jgi:hypothetical protein
MQVLNIQLMKLCDNHFSIGQMKQESGISTIFGIFPNHSTHSASANDAERSARLFVLIPPYPAGATASFAAVADGTG